MWASWVSAFCGACCQKICQQVTALGASGFIYLGPRVCCSQLTVIVVLVVGAPLLDFRPRLSHRKSGPSESLLPVLSLWWECLSWILSRALATGRVAHLTQCAASVVLVVGVPLSDFRPRLSHRKSGPSESLCCHCCPCYCCGQCHVPNPMPIAISCKGGQQNSTNNFRKKSVPLRRCDMFWSHFTWSLPGDGPASWDVTQDNGLHATGSSQGIQD